MALLASACRLLGRRADRTMRQRGWCFRLEEGPQGLELAAAMRDGTERCDGLMLATVARVMTGELQLSFEEARAIRERHAAKSGGGGGESLVG